MTHSAANDPQLKQCPECQVIEEGSVQFCGECGVPLRDQVMIAGRHRVIRELGRGAYGSVWHAVDTTLGRDVAIKLLKPVSGASKQFEGEVKALSSIKDHAYVVTVFDGGLLKPDNRPFIVMEKLDGQTLEAYRRNLPDACLPPLRALSFIMQAARGIAAAHRQGIIHRDLSPRNLFVLNEDRDGEPQIRVLDFGVALLKKEDKGLSRVPLIGTPGFVAPELTQGEAPASTSDIYSLGAIWFLLLTGNPAPSQGIEDRIDLAASRLQRQGHRLSAEGLKLLKDMLSAQVDKRPADGSALLSRMSKLPELNTERPAATTPRPRPRIVVGLVLAVAALASIVGSILFFREDLLRETVALAEQGLRAQDPKNRQLGVKALAQARDDQYAARILPLLKDESPEVGLAVLRALAEMRARSTLPALRDFRDRTSSAKLAAQASLAMHRLGASDGLPWLRARFQAEEPNLRWHSALALVEEYDPKTDAAAYVQRVLRDQEGEGVTQPLLLLAKQDDPWALQKLRDYMTQPPPGVSSILVAGILAGRFDPAARALLERTAQAPGEQRLEAVRQLAELGEQSACAKLREVSARSDNAAEVREVATDGLLFCREPSARDAAASIVRNKPLGMRLRLRAATVLLRHLLGSAGDAAARMLRDLDALIEPGELGAGAIQEERSLVWGLPVESAGIPGSSPAGEGLPAAVRERMLRHGRWTLDRLLVALDHAPAASRAGILSAIGRIAGSVQRAGELPDAARITKRLEAFLTDPDAWVKSAASAALYRLGDRKQEDSLRRALSSADFRIRRQSLEVLPIDRTQLVSLLADPDPGVRLAAAQRLITLRAREEVIPTLGALVQRGGAHGLLAYELLRQLGERPPYPQDKLKELLASGILPDRLAVIELSADLPTALALPLLRMAVRDPAAVIRRRVIEQCLQRLLRDRRAPVELRYMIEYLRNDDEYIVRIWAQDALDVLAAGSSGASDSAGSGTPDRAPVDMGAADLRGGHDRASGTLVLRRGPEVRVWVDGSPIKPNDTSVPLPAGSHTVSYVIGQQQVRIDPERTTRFEVPVQAVQQFLFEGRRALGERRMKAAKAAFDEARLLFHRLKADPPVIAEYDYWQARFFEAQGQKNDAMPLYLDYLELARKGFYREYQESVQTAVGQLRKEFGEILIYRRAGKDCVLSERRFLKPVPGQIIQIHGPDGKDLLRKVFPAAGQVEEVKDACRQ